MKEIIIQIKKDIKGENESEDERITERAQIRKIVLGKDIWKIFVAV